MLPFEFYNPTRIVFGEGKIAELDRLVPRNAKVLVLIGGGSVEKNGTLAEVRAALGTRAYSIFRGIEPNPTFETLMEAVAQVRREGIDFLLAVGGGSVLDGTKFVAAAVPWSGDPWEFMVDHGKNVKTALPVGTVLTLPATGSESNSTGVITRKSLKAKLFFASEATYPVFSILDPAKTFTLPERQVANGIVDAFVHVTEQYLTCPAGGHVQDRFSEGLLSTLMELGPRVLAEPDNLEVRANIMWAATLALNGLIGAGVPQDWGAHGIGHEITALHGIDHARSLTLVLPALLEVRFEIKRAKLAQMAERVLGIHEGTEESRARAAIFRMCTFFESMGCPTRLSACGLDAAAIPPLLRQLEAHGMTAMGEDKGQTLEVSRAILEAAL
jgi:NADP-dependent alcohol dehydrogenase